MGFLSNDSDILCDFVLTDLGRYRLSKGDGSFKIVKFAVGDDEINYAQYNKNHASGSAYYDLDILQTPVFEAFTNNASSMQSKLISIPRTNLLYLPIIKINELPTENTRHSTGTFIVACDETTEDDLLLATDKKGILKGARPGGSSNGAGGGTVIRLDQGLDTNEISPSFTIDSDLVETQYIVEIDNRLGSICDVNGNSAKVSFIDDDNIASYYLSLGTDSSYVSENTQKDAAAGTETIRGPRGTILKFKIRTSIDLSTSTFLFTQLGSTTTVNGYLVNYIDTNVRITGATTGNSISVPCRFCKV